MHEPALTRRNKLQLTDRENRRYLHCYQVFVADFYHEAVPLFFEDFQ